MENLLPISPLAIKPWQRLAAALHATGTPISDISVSVNQPVPLVSAFITSPAGASIVGSILSENQDRLKDLLDAAGVDSLLVLLKIRDSPSSKNSEKISACKEILARVLPGVKAKEFVGKTGSAKSHDPDDEITRLENELKTI